MKSTLASCLFLLAGADLSDEWMDWECPGFPCSIVNYYDNRGEAQGIPEHTNYQQTCTPLSAMAECSKLIDGRSFFANTSDGTIIWHNSTNPARPHRDVCKNPWGGCDQTGCLQGTRTKCYALCDRLNLIYPYDDRCKRMCRKSCPDDTSESFACSECEAHGHGADQCGCGYCGSWGGCGWTCGNDPNQPPTGPKCFTLPPAPPPTPWSPPAPPAPPAPAPTPGPEKIACSECEAHGHGADQCGCGYCGSWGGCGWTCGNDPNQPPTGPKCSTSPPSPPTPGPSPTPGPNPNLPAGGCCSWAGPKEIDVCGNSTTWCKANAANCEACEGHWACPDGPCPASTPAPIPSGGCCSWAEAIEEQMCGSSTGYCMANPKQCRDCNGHWIHPSMLVV